MKFTNGYWLTKEGFAVNNPKQVYDYKINDDNVQIYAPYKKINERGDTLNIGMTTVSVTSPLKNVIGIKLTHFDQLPKDPSFDLNDQHVKLATTTDDNTLRIQSGDLSANFPIDGSDFEINFEANGQVITKSEPNAEGEITKTDDQTHYMREQLSIGIDELVYGLGERFTSFVKTAKSSI